MPIRTVCIAALLFLTSGLVTSASADAYRWQDNHGNVFYGTKPPAGAVGVAKLEAKSFSRYSSDKVLRGHRSDIPASTRTRIKEEDLPVLTEEAQTTTEEPSINLPPKLEQGRLIVTHGSNQEITSCKVTIRNSGSETAKKVGVTFEFEDGSILPGAGPDAISARGEAVYFISPEHLPVTIKRTFDGVSFKQAPRPKVIFQFSPET